MITLNTIKAHPGATHRKKRLGRGVGSGKGRTAGKGHKGQLARSGGTSRPGFEGGQTPLYRRLPKRGFKNFACRDIAVLNLSQLEEMDTAQMTEISLESLKAAKLIKGRYDRLTLLGNGELSKTLKVRAHRISKSAQEKIQKAGGSVEVLPAPSRVTPAKNTATQA